MSPEEQTLLVNQFMKEQQAQRDLMLAQNKRQHETNTLIFGKLEKVTEALVLTNKKLDNNAHKTPCTGLKEIQEEKAENEKRKKDIMYSIVGKAIWTIICLAVVAMIFYLQNK